jgi:hypothetical protein
VDGVVRKQRAFPDGERVTSILERNRSREPRLILQSANKAVDVAEYKKVSYLGTVEGEDRHTPPPHVAAARRHSKQFLPLGF